MDRSPLNQRLRRLQAGVVAACLWFLLPQWVFSQTESAVSSGPTNIQRVRASVPISRIERLPINNTLLTNIQDIWTVPRERRGQLHRMKTEIIIYYLDAEWNNAWGECDGRPTYLYIANAPVPLRAGQRVALDGVVMPIRERFIWEQTRITVLEEQVELKATPVSNLTENPHPLSGRLIAVEGLIDQLIEDPTHVTLKFLTRDAAATAYVLKGTNQGTLHFKEGDFVRMKCVFSPQFDKSGGLSSLGLLVAQPRDIEVIGQLKTDPRFELPLTSSAQIWEDSPTNSLLRVRGVVRSHEPGKWVTIWDDQGQIFVQSRQTQPLRFGDEIEAVGYPFVLGVQQCLHGGVYRRVSSTNGVARGLALEGILPLRLAERIRDLDRATARRGLPVELRAVVTWSHPDTPFAYVQDASCGVRVVNPKWETEDAAKPGTVVMVRGEVAEGDFVPVITNAVLSRVGWWNLEEVDLVRLEQALTGVEDGRWVKMRGYVQAVTKVEGLMRLDLSTPSGEFRVWTPATESFDYLRGSTIRVQGVCASISNSRHQLTGIQVWAPEIKYIQVEEPAPGDLFAVPFRPLDSLRQFNLQNGLNQRLRTAGTVVLHAPGRYVCVQDGEDSVFALSRQQEKLKPGDRVEVVGFPGNEGRRFILREAVYRRVSSGTEPEPAVLPAGHSVDPDLAGLAARAEGTLLNSVRKEGESRFLIQSGDTAFEVSLASNASPPEPLRNLESGSRLAVTGVYEPQSDEYGKPRSFLLRLRSWEDVRVLARPPWWTVARLLWVSAGVLGICLISLGWGVIVHRKNALLRVAQAKLELANDQLELRVAMRTRELQNQVAAEERARAELARAQQDLVLTSRRAGMAEVATGVLHNVGNVLNSVNVSATLLTERLRACRVESVAKTAGLLSKHQNQIGRFVSEDPKGRILPGYLEKLAEMLMQDKRVMLHEIDSLSKNVDHIKAIVGMQQSYAKVVGVLEPLDPKDLAEDAIQINCAGFDRHRIQLVRDFQPVPRVMVDRHKVLQILVNLLSNAKHALGERTSDKRVVISIAPAGSNRVRLTVSDNGIGIPPENLSRIFSQGFTTRKDGHGFGLHSGANAARELGGSLSASSEGVGRGAVFSLELPAGAAENAMLGTKPARSG